MTDYESFLQWLQDHNYCKVIPCANCHFWGFKGDPRRTGEKHCRHHDINTYHDDYCSDAIERRSDE